jgi:Cu(I)/Ag(I) efflux system membrane fusion protein/cobalt-zinc-cadmium efflux system membrane fusion protein
LREKARDVHVRLIFSNPNLDLKPGMYVNVQLEGRVIPDALVLPSEAIIRSGQRMMAFVAKGEGQFEPREIEIAEEGGPRNSFVRILSGLSEGEPVVVSAQFLIDSESRLQEAIRKMLQPGENETQGKIQQMPPMPPMESDSDVRDVDAAATEHDHEG